MINQARSRRSREGAWIEINLPFSLGRAYGGRSREGAWIEIAAGGLIGGALSVAPVRERGLKLVDLRLIVDQIPRRSREGAWIEIV